MHYFWANSSTVQMKSNRGSAPIFRPRSKAKIQKALKLIQILREVAPVYEVKAKISTGKIQYEDSEEVQPLLVTIYEELDQVPILAPVFEAKKRAAESNDPHLMEGPYHYTRAFLDATLAERLLIVAQQSLEKKDFKSADLALLNLQLSVALEYHEEDVPLSFASKSLMMARNFYHQGNIRQAKMAIGEAQEALSVYQKRVGDLKGSETQKLINEMDTFKKQIQANQPQASEKIMNWWDQLAMWYH